MRICANRIDCQQQITVATKSMIKMTFSDFIILNAAGIVF